MKTDAAKRKNLISAAQAAARFACLVVALLLAQTSVWGFGISQELASSHFAELVPSSVEGNAVAIEYDASDCAVAAARVESRALVPYSGQATPTSWPGNGGFLTGPSKRTLSPGTVIDRYGAGTGTYAAPAGTPFGMRGLPAAYETTQPLNTYRVLQPIEVNAGNAAPAFGQPGLGTQYQLPFSVNDLIELKVLTPH